MCTYARDCIIFDDLRWGDDRKEGKRIGSRVGSGMTERGGGKNRQLEEVYLYLYILVY